MAFPKILSAEVSQRGFLLIAKKKKKKKERERERKAPEVIGIDKRVGQSQKTFKETRIWNCLGSMNRAKSNENPTDFQRFELGSAWSGKVK